MSSLPPSDRRRAAVARRWLLGLALGVTGTIMLLPETAPLARHQLGEAAGALVLHAIPNPGSRDTDPAGRERVLARHPQDLGLHLAHALRLSSPATAASGVPGTAPVAGAGSTREVDSREVALAALSSRFDGEPALYANRIRTAMLGAVTIRREEPALFAETPAAARRRWDPTRDVPDPETLRTVLADTAAGERLEPGNAYFPAMAAVALTAAHRDTEAAAALARAATLPSWEEHWGVVVEGDWRLDSALGSDTALTRLARAYGLLLPHYAQLREAARVTLWQAVEEERAGRIAAGLARRRQVAQLGATLRDECRLLIGNLVGSALVELAVRRPGGAPAPRLRPPQAPPRREQERARFLSWVERHAGPGEAGWWRRQLEAGDSLRNIAATTWLRLEVPAHLLGLQWSAGRSLLLGAIWLALLGMAGAALCRTRWGRSGSALPAWVRRAALIGMALGALGQALLLLPTLAGGSRGAAGLVLLPAMVPVLVLAGGACLVLPWMRARAAGTRPSVAALAFLGALLLPPLLGTLLLQQAQTLEAGREHWLAGEGGELPFRSAALALAALGPALPAALLALFAGASLVLRVPLAVGVARGFRSSALPLVCLLLVGWGGLLLVTARQEAGLKHELALVLSRGEAQLAAERLGRHQPPPPVAPGVAPVLR